MRVHVVCPVCHEALQYEHLSTDGIAYGTIDPWDLACAVITINNPDGKIAEHLDAHRKDGSHMAKLEELMGFETARAERHAQWKAEGKI